MATQEQQKLWNRKYYLANKEKISEQRKKYLSANKDSIAKQTKAYREKNKEKIALQRKEYRELNKEKIAIQRKASRSKKKKDNYEYVKKRYKSDSIFRFQLNLRNRIKRAFKYIKSNKPDKTNKLLGASYNEVKIYIEKQFSDGMNWSNYGQWHIDHIIPLAKAKTNEELIKLCHYSNLQPLWAMDNFRKNRF